MTTGAADPIPPIGPIVDPTPAKRPARVILRGRLVELTPLDPSIHADALYEGTCGPGRDDLWLYLAYGPFADRAGFEASLKTMAASDDPLFFSIIDNRSRKALGWASYMRVEPFHRVIEVGHIVFSPGLQRTAGATEALYLMSRHVFEELGYRRFEWKCNALNAPSRRAALRLGFTFEGIFRQHMIVKARSRDTAWFSMLDSEWPARKQAFERWLLPSNFDETGRQKTSLSALNAPRS